MNKINFIFAFMLFFVMACGNKSQEVTTDTIASEVTPVQTETVSDTSESKAMGAVALFQDSVYQDSINDVLGTDTMTSVNGLLDALTRQ